MNAALLQEQEQLAQEAEALAAQVEQQRLAEEARLQAEGQERQRLMMEEFRLFQEFQRARQEQQQGNVMLGPEPRPNDNGRQLTGQI